MNANREIQEGLLVGKCALSLLCFKRWGGEGRFQLVKQVFPSFFSSFPPSLPLQWPLNKVVSSETFSGHTGRSRSPLLPQPCHCPWMSLSFTFSVPELDHERLRSRAHHPPTTPPLAEHGAHSRGSANFVKGMVLRINKMQSLDLELPGVTWQKKGGSWTANCSPPS